MAHFGMTSLYTAIGLDALNFGVCRETPKLRTKLLDRSSLCCSRLGCLLIKELPEIGTTGNADLNPANVVVFAKGFDAS